MAVSSWREWVNSQIMTLESSDPMRGPPWVEGAPESHFENGADSEGLVDVAGPGSSLAEIVKASLQVCSRFVGDSRGDRDGVPGG
jgi:hypothetical protein